MHEIIELKTFSSPNNLESDAIEEYDEIKEENNSRQLSLLHRKIRKGPINEFDFFTKTDVKSLKKSTRKKKKHNDKYTDLMDIINNELAVTEIPIKRNVIESLDFTKIQKQSYLHKQPTLRELFERKRWYSDLERGWNRNSTLKLSPSFPNSLEYNKPTRDYIPVEYCKPINYDEVISDNSTVSIDDTKFLNVELKSLKYTHHHKFPLEKLLSEKLLEVYNEYIQCVAEKIRFNNEIKINREAKTKLKNELLKIALKKDEVRFDETIRKYTEQIIEHKAKFIDILKKEREILNGLVSLWSDIQNVREKTGVKLTAYELNILKTELDSETYEQEWNDVYSIEFTDLLDKTEHDFVQRYLSYKENKHKQVDAGQKKKLHKPKMIISEDKLKEEAKSFANDVVKSEKYEVKLMTSNKPKKPTKYEKEFTKISFKIYIDDHFVCESENCYIDNSFSSDLTESFSIQILPDNEFLKMYLYENGEVSISHIIEIRSINKKLSNSQGEIIKIVSNDLIEPNNQCVGSGFKIKEIASNNKVRLKGANLFKGNLYTTCELSANICWNDSLNQNNSEDVKRYTEVNAKITKLLTGQETPTLDNLKNLIEEVYEQDISRNESMVKKLGEMSKCKMREETNFDAVDQSQNHVRVQLLNLRSRGEMNDVDNKRIPFHDSQISTEQLNCLQKAKDEAFDPSYLRPDKHGDLHPIELQRFMGIKYVAKLNESLKKKLHDILTKKSYRELVYDFDSFSLRSLFSNETTLTSLTKFNNTYKRMDIDDLVTKECEIYVRVYRAFNLPDRSNYILSEGHTDDEEENIAGYKLRSLRPFVKINYEGLSAQTATSIGCHPTWNQTLKIRVKPRHLSSIQINIYDEQKVDVTEHYESDNPFNSRTLHFRCMNKWIGCVDVPLYSVFESGKIKGTFKINTPSLLLGYDKHVGEKETNRSLIPEVTRLLKKEASFIAVQVTTNLTQNGGIMRNDLGKLSNTDDEYILKHLNNFLTEFSNDFPNRPISLTKIDSIGSIKCVTQFLQPLSLPENDWFPKNGKRSDSAVSKGSNLSKSSSSKSTEREVDKDPSYSGYETRNWRQGDGLDKMMNAAMRLVALVPTYEVKEPYVATLRGVELLKTLHGSPLDHTILLASYFLYLGLKTYIISGYGLPRGKSYYVLTKYDIKLKRPILANEPQVRRMFSKTEGTIWYVYDAVCGERFELRDVSCPLKTVDYLYDNENIWVNVQSSTYCEHVSFDLTKSSDWQQVFDKSIFIMKLPILNDSSLYKKQLETENLRSLLENKIRVKIQKWRSQVKTIWNRYCSSLLRESLPQWERWAFSPDHSRPVLGQRMRQLMMTYRVYGYPINVPFTSTKALISLIKSTNIQMNDDPNVEFGLAVEVYGYPNNILSVWVFLACLSRIA